MTRRSTVTPRATPAHGVSAVSGGMIVRADTLTIATTERVQLVDLTDRLMAVVRESGVREGVVSLWSMHTTCALFINETQLALHADIKRFLEEIVSRDTKWLHNDPEHSDCDRMNADAHLRAMLLGHSLTLQVTSSEPVLGHWQRVLMAELDGPRERTVRVQILGMR